MKTKWLVILFMMLPMMVLADKKGKYGDDVRWTYVKATHTLTISGRGPMKNDRYKPWDSFKEDIQTIIIEEGVTRLGLYTFKECINLTSVTLPKSLKVISDHAFYKCSSLTSINIPNGVTSIGDGAFFRCKKLKSVSIPNSVKTIGSFAFCGCESLTSVVIPSGVTAIKKNAFNDCKNLISVSIPYSVTEIGEAAFADCINLKSVNVPNKWATIDPNVTWDYITKRKTDTVITQIDDDAAGNTSVAQAVPQTVEVKSPAVSPAQPQSVPQAQTSPNLNTEQVVNVDQDIFVSKTVDKNTFAVIIGNEKYADEVGVPFAENDAKVFKEYVNKTLGVPEKQIKFLTNATFNNIRSAVRWLNQAMSVCGGKGRVLFYYAGHGIPDEANGSAYLLPTDGSGSDIGSAYPLETLYGEFEKMNADRITVFLDACFSGAKREGGMLAMARGVAIKSRPTEPKAKMIVFTAAQGDETAYPFKSQKHGMFTYYLLRKLQETKGNVTLGELSNYLATEVKRVSFMENNKIQTPYVNASPALKEAWMDLKLKQ